MSAPAGLDERRADPGRGAAPRFRSARRVPAALTALVVLGGAGLFLYDLAAVRARRPGMRWRHELARLLERHAPADTGVVVAGAVLVLAGAALLFLALAPGLRSVLPLRSPGPPRPAGGAPEVRAGIGRKAAALVLRDRAMEVSGVRSARVTVARSHVTVRAASHFRELDDVRADLEAVLAVGLAELGLAHEPRPRVRVDPAGKG
ncbi:DUF6286 domain-containing protein [Streptomyces sp. NPDC098789]|uniref:DUF6286 domain-containing protein n=1 Tax=Streptomyces sp. NPDC098789 TaxID=3366098 RepID=UPI00381F4139